MSNLKTEYKPPSIDIDNAILVSIPHTGTRFIKMRSGVARFIHVHADWDKLIKQCRQFKRIISPLRDPRACWISTARRSKNPENPEYIARFFKAWYHMHALSVRRQIDFIPVDLQQDERITDWSHVGHTDPTQSEEVPDIYLGYLYTLPFVEKYYGNFGKTNNI